MLVEKVKRSYTLCFCALFHEIIALMYTKKVIKLDLATHLQCVTVVAAISISPISLSFSSSQPKPNFSSMVKQSQVISRNPSGGSFHQSYAQGVYLARNNVVIEVVKGGVPTMPRMSGRSRLFIVICFSLSCNHLTS